MEIFFQDLARKLDEERPYWRKNTIILLDNAPYHHGAGMSKVFEKLQMPICYTGPHSYDASPVELVFAAFKSKDINPRHVKTGKG